MGSMMQQQSSQEAEGRSYWVVGGAYTGTDFNQVADRQSVEERFGPFASYAEAFAEWSRLAWRTVDDAHTRYRIEKTDESS